MTASCVIHPIDLTKVRLQLAGEGTGVRPSALGVMKDIVRNEGVTGLYSGLSASIMRQAVYGTARLGLHRQFSNELLKRSGEADTMKPAAQRRHYTSIFNALIRISREEGVARLWRGAAPTVLRAMAMNFGMMASYDQVKESITAWRGLDQTTLLMSAAAAGFFCAFVSLPFDMIKTRLQNMTVLPNGRMPYTGVVSCASSLIQKEGFLALWSGFGAYYGRCAPHAMVILLTMEQINTMYKKFVLGE